MKRSIGILILLALPLFTAVGCRATHHMTVTVPLESAADLRLREILEMPLREIAADEQPAEKIFLFLRDTTRINIDVRWDELQGAAIGKDTPVTIDLRGVPLRKVITTILSTLSPDAKLGYLIEDGVVTISTEWHLAAIARKSTQVYNVRDIPGTDPHNAAENGKTLTQIITQKVYPDTWACHGGSVGKIDMFNGLMIVQTTTAIHLEIEDFLTKLRIADQKHPVKKVPEPTPSSSPK